MTQYDGTDVLSQATVCSLLTQTHINHTAGLYVDGLRQPEFGRGLGSFVNHDVSANAKTERIDGAVVIVATKDINAGEEVTIFYGPKESDSYKVAMGQARYVASRRADGSTDVTCIPIPVPGYIIRYHAIVGLNAVEQLASDMHLEVKNPSADAHGCFHRCVAIALRGLLTSSEDAKVAIKGDHRKLALAYVDGVDVDALSRGESEFPSVAHMRGVTATYVRSLGDYWGNLENPSDPGDETTVGQALTALAGDEQASRHGVRGGQQIDLASDELPGNSDGGGQSEVIERMAKALTARTADCGELAFRLITYMFGVDLHIFDVTTCELTSLLVVSVATRLRL